MNSEEQIAQLEEQLKAMTDLATSLYYTMGTMHLTGKCGTADGTHSRALCIHTKENMSCSWDMARQSFLGGLSDRARELIKFPQPSSEAVYPKGHYHGD